MQGGRTLRDARGWRGRLQVHIDPLGGWSGDMFVAACLDSFPDLWPTVRRAVATLKLGPEAECRLVPHHDGAMTGKRFLVAAEPGLHKPAPAHGHSHGGPQSHAHDHRHDGRHDEAHGHGPHRAWRDIRLMLERADLDRAVLATAVAIFRELAEAEAAVHGVAVEDVTFHEVGAVDSIVDIVAAAVLVVGIGASRWTSAPLPLGGGRVRTQHGILPVPAPATALLLRGLPTIDDGISGERVTPTGAAIARHLLKDAPSAPAVSRRLQASGTGFGTRTLPGISNHLRVLAFVEAKGFSEAEGVAKEASPATGRYGHRELAVIEFEVDDQSAEDLSHGLDQLRALPGVHDAIQSVAFGKKGRIATHVQVLVAPDRLDDTIARCFTETTTIGLRYHTVQGAALRRAETTVAVDGRTLRVKTVVRPDGTTTGKTEAGDVATDAGHAARVALRRAGEAAALGRDGGSDGEGGA